MLTVVLLSLLGQQAAAPVQLSRVFKANTTLNYRVESHLTVEQRQMGLNTWIPADIDYQYDYSLAVQKEKADGIVEMRYRRPTLTRIDGETFDDPPKTTVEKVNWDMQLVTSPLNEVLETKILGGAKRINLFAPQGQGVEVTQEVLNAFSELYRLALFAGTFEASLDLAPRLPVEAVTVGSQWKRTVGYSAQQLQNTNNKQAVQRLDYTYTYQGLQQVGQSKVHRIVGELKFQNDMAQFVHQVTGTGPGRTRLKTLPLRFNARILFDLDPVSMDTLAANAVCDGGFSITSIDQPGRPQHEERFKGRTTLRLVSKKPTASSGKAKR